MLWVGAAAAAALCCVLLCTPMRPHCCPSHNLVFRGQDVPAPHAGPPGVQLCVRRSAARAAAGAGEQVAGLRWLAGWGGWQGGAWRGQWHVPTTSLPGAGKGPPASSAWHACAHSPCSHAARARHHVLQGQGGLYLAGAWAGYGFHEDGIKSAVAAVEAMGARRGAGGRRLRQRCSHACTPPHSADCFPSISLLQVAPSPGCRAPSPPRSGCWTRPPSACSTGQRGIRPGHSPEPRPCRLPMRVATSPPARFSYTSLPALAPPAAGLRGPPSRRGTCAWCCPTAPSWCTGTGPRPLPLCPRVRQVWAWVQQRAARAALPRQEVVVGDGVLSADRPHLPGLVCRRGVARPPPAVRHRAAVQRRLLPQGHHPARHRCACAFACAWVRSRHASPCHLLCSILLHSSQIAPTSPSYA